MIDSSSLGLDSDSGRPSNDDLARHVQEQAMFDHPLQRRYLLPGGECVLDRRLKVQINDVIRVIGHIWLSIITLQPQFSLTAQFLEDLLQPPQVVLPAELNHLDRHSKAAAAEPINELGLIDDDHELITGSFDHLLPEEGAATALDEVEVRVDLIGAIYCEVNAGVFVEDGERDAEGCGLLSGALGGGDADDVGDLAGGEEVANAGDGEGGGGAGSEAENHAGFDGVDGFLGGKFLEVVLGDDGWRGRGGCGHGDDHGIAAGEGVSGAEAEAEAKAGSSGAILVVGEGGGGGGGGGGQRQQG
ncbi:hypothetical protein Dimus_021795 [Dionaea muscipula]